MPFLPFALSWPALAIAALVLCLIERTVAYFKGRREINYVPGKVYIASPFSFPGTILPSNKYNPGMSLTWHCKDTLYADSPIEMASAMGLLFGQHALYTNSPEVVKQVLSNKAPWEKIRESVNSLGPFGPNVFATMRDEWPRHRKAVAPGFNSRLYPSVWSETVETYYDCMAAEKWEKEKEFIMPDVTAITSKFALFLIAKCGFGIDLAWNEDLGERVNGMTLPECFDVTSRSVLILSFLPHWMYRLPIRPLRRLSEASMILQKILQGIIDKRRAEGFTKEDQRRDVFSLLLAANELEKGSKGALTDQELVSNVFLLLLAGHETTSKALAATLGELACNPDQQERTYQEIKSVVKDGKDPTYDDFEKLPFTQGCFMEGLRMYPSALMIMRICTEDTVLQVPSKSGETVPFPVHKKKTIGIDFAGVAYNPRICPEPYSYKPERWLDPSTEPLLTFSYGPRVCIGKRFAVVESTAVLALMLRDWKIEPVLKPGQSLHDWHEIWKDNVEGTIGFGHKRFPLKFTRR